MVARIYDIVNEINKKADKCKYKELYELAKVVDNDSI